EAAVPAEEALVLVEYGFEYRAKDGTLVSIKPNERYVLLKRTNHHWWHVKRSGDARPFYIPAQYVKELPPIATPAPLEPPRLGHTGTDPATLVPQPPPAYEYRFMGAAEAEEPAGGCSVPRRDLVPRRDTPPALSSFRVPSGLSPHLTKPVRPSHSLDDLARVTPAPRRATAAGSRGNPPGHPRPLGKSRSETLHAPGKDRDVARRWPGSGHAAQHEEPPTPIYLNIQQLQEEAAAASSALEEPSSSVSDWETHTDTDSGHLFYYNPVTGETTWDCPFGQAEDGVSPTASPASSLAHSPECPEWEQYVDEASGQAFFYNSVTGETSWDPPHAGDGGSSQDMYPGVTRYGPMEQRPPTPETDYPDLSPDELEGYPEEDYSPMGSYDQGDALSLSPRRPEELGSPPGWYGHSQPEGAVFCPEHFASDTVRGRGREWDGGQPALPHPGAGEGRGKPDPPPTHSLPSSLRASKKPGCSTGPRRWTEGSGSGKRITVSPATGKGSPGGTEGTGTVLSPCVTPPLLPRKNWSSSWTVLEGGILTFFKDSKHSTAGALRQPSTLTTPEHTVELRGATLAWASKDKSSKKHVLELKTREGSEFLIQHDSEQIIAAWQKAIADSIGRLVSGRPPNPALPPRGWAQGAPQSLGTMVTCAPPLPAAGPAPGSASGESDTNRVRTKLRKFLQRRPTLQSVRERGYIKDQIFGCSLQALCERERGTVPRFVLQCIQTVERRGLDIDGLYRVSGNLATIQKLRYKVEHDELLDLDDGRWEDIHVVTGALKLFFRELPEPLVPFAHFDKFIAAI
ncbi:RHG27 protein, partial [Ardeotis kori]|nr:RHG27 protein [Ardeotis kori]